MESVRATGMPWFDEDDYESFRAILPDRHWHPTFKELETAAQQNLERLRNHGIVTVKAKARAAEFVAWCKSTGRNVNTKAPLAFANEAALRVIKNQH